MSRIGRKPVAIPSGVTVLVTNGDVKVAGPKGTLHFPLPVGVTLKMEGEVVCVEAQAGKSAFHGLTRAIVANMVRGVSSGYEKRLEIIGVGYRVQMKGQTLGLNVGFTHPVDIPIPEGLEITQEEKNKNILIVRGIDKWLVGQFAASVRSVQPPEPYKGKGIRYVGEIVRRKVGKSAAAKSPGVS
ncbi:50S ribosomal protein L6 [Candidatus Peribacteria bacterium RIFCSPLOWO2_12_FULL_55_15]|nr:MAG: 50S ribosomal protein L6 [Candidatus Peribacteria bacterium RIFCSPHIGHO2_01_FULL_54_22]OGJ63018.1 MAG: 50S ribosomal protein L6 [Candidatus Peribacteria bacterium RIFCSPHIGHO2_02_FULL_55_24]OGJ63922.1 MAG: 50S ribosomal protein L6 [Candidatus Peribacteria bacterium RIFCSPHIGHO2_12_FULL_54_10]OGJ68622.1 MAG: 50S ribosomal protein L6 [Candidatus Peribacteria bacterium RIFCSPLOWO2_01_FULL_54_110]OGJ68843.1 MAG: 50S ribosomal protein L6 [Candidatus Peribacteria bacterium RIFCSPLOWO2_02_FULL